MYYAKSQNCCAELRAILNSGPDGGNCPATGDCRGPFSGTCSQLSDQFAQLPVLPDYPNGLQDYQCHLFPDDDKVSDSFIVGLISFAVALPTSMFIKNCFELASDNEAPESLLVWRGSIRLFFGFTAHRHWHYTHAAPPLRFVSW